MHKRKSYRTNQRNHRLAIERLEARDLLAVDFDFNYLPGAPVGFNDPVNGSAYRTALESAASRLGSWLLHDAVIEIDVSGYAFDGTSIGTAGSYVAPPLPGGGFVHHLIPEKILNGNDFNGSDADGNVDIYFFDENDIFTYQLDPSLGIADDELDFQALVIHELLHTVGFTSSTNASGRDDNGKGTSTPGTWSVFDQFVSDVNGNRFIDGDPNSPTAFRMDLAAWQVHSTGGQGPNAGLFFDGPTAKSVYGSRVPLYSPNTFRIESSVAHLDSEGYPNSDYIFSPLTHLMSHALVDRAVPQELTLLEKAILTDLGFRVHEDVPPVITAPDQLIIEANTPSGYSGSDQPLTEFIGLVTVTDQLDPEPVFEYTLPTDFSLGERPIQLAATDLSGNQTFLSPVMAIVDTTPPLLEVTPTTLTVEATSAAGYRFDELNFSTQATDLVDLNPSITDDAPEYLTLGANLVNFNATDFSNNSSIKTATILVQDTTPPNFSPPSSLEISANRLDGADLTNLQELHLLSSFASDLVDEILDLTASPNFLPLGTSEVVFSAIDDSGNQTDATVMVTVVGPFDMGDAPPIYPVQLHRDGARHQPSNLYLGEQIDFDLDGNVSSDATGDSPDEDGVRMLTTPIASNSSTNVTSWFITASQNGFIDAWIDSDHNGNWDTPGEQVLQGIPVEQGDNLVSVPIMASSVSGDTFLRIRISSVGNLLPTGSAADGEVEDYQISLKAADPTNMAWVDWVSTSATLTLSENDVRLIAESITIFQTAKQDTGTLKILGNATDQTLFLDWNHQAATHGPTLHLDGQAGENTIQWFGPSPRINLRDQNDLLVSRFAIHDLTAAEPQTLEIDQLSIQRLAPLTKKLVIRLGEADEIYATDQTDWRLSEPRQEGNTWILPANHLTDPLSKLDVIPVSVWNNYLLHGDINNDGNVTANDALLIINELAARRFSAPDTQSVHPVSEIASWPNHFFDQNRDNRVTALDALRVINDMSRLNLENGGGEAESIAVGGSIEQPTTLPSPSFQIPATHNPSLDNDIAINQVNSPRQAFRLSHTAKMSQFRNTGFFERKSPSVPSAPNTSTNQIPSNTPEEPPPHDNLDKLLSKAIPWHKQVDGR